MPNRTARPARRVNTLYATTSSTTPRALAQHVGPVVYAYRMWDGVIKIGHTKHVLNRISHYGPMSGLLALRAGTVEDEKAIHRALIQHRARAHEYYHPTAEVLAVVNEMRAAMRLEPLSA